MNHLLVVADMLVKLAARLDDVPSLTHQDCVVIGADLRAVSDSCLTTARFVERELAVLITARHAEA